MEGSLLFLEKLALLPEIPRLVKYVSMFSYRSMGYLKIEEHCPTEKKIHQIAYINKKQVTCFIVVTIFVTLNL